MQRSPAIARGSHDAMYKENEDPVSESEDSSRDTADVNSERDSQIDDMQALQMRMSELSTSSTPITPRRRLNMTEPAPQHKLQREEITIEPLTVTHVRYPTTAQFERGVKLSRRATYTPQFFNSISFKGADDVYSTARRASLGSHVAVERNVEYEKQAEPQIPVDRSWKKSMPSSSNDMPKEKKTPPTNNQTEVEEPKRHRFSSKLRRWFH